MPKRIQMTRQRPWRADHPDAVIVARPSRWGNPFNGEVGAATMTRQLLADDFRTWISMPTRTDPRNGAVRTFSGCEAYLGVPYASRPTVEEIRRELAGKDLACWCPLDQPCHADILLELANADPQAVA